MSLLARDLWQEVQGVFRNERGVAIADVWLQQTYPIEFSRGVFTLAVPNEVVREWIEHRYREDLESIFLRLTGSRVRVLLRVDKRLPTVARQTAMDVPAGEAVGEVPFVVRPENRLAFAAVQRLLAEPATGNPLFLYGPSGSGKSTLVRHHLDLYAARHGNTRTTVIVTAEAFSSGLVRAIRERDLSAFRGRMLAADAFVLEEAHRLRGKTRTQREFLSVLQYHVLRGRPVIMTSRHPPNAIFLLDEGLRSHFLSGMLHRIADYSVPSRAAVLESVARKFVREVPAETIERIAQRVPGALGRQVRFLKKVAAFAALEDRRATIEYVGEKFPELAGGGERDIDLQVLVSLVAREFAVAPEDIASNRKVRRAVLARHLIIYVATTVFSLTARRVMRHLGGLSPSTTAYARRKIEQRRRDDPLFDIQVKRILDELDAGQKMLF